MIAAKSTACSSVGQCWLRAWERAKAERLIPYRETLTTWTVKHYTVTVTGAGWSDLACSCPAGRSHKTCKHMAVVAKAISAHVLPVKGTAKRHEASGSVAPEWRVPLPYGSSQPLSDVGNRPVPPLLDGPLT